MLAETEVRARELAMRQERQVARRVDRWFAALLISQWLGAVGVAVWVSPWAWEENVNRLHAHVLTAVGLGAAIVSIPVALAILRPARTSTRYAVAVGQMLMGSLLIHLTGGRVETHYHIFGSLALLAFYRDWKVVVVASAVAVADHFLRNALWPRSVFGGDASSPWRWAEHAAWVVVEDIFLIRSCLRVAAERREFANRQAELEAIQVRVERDFQARTTELCLANDQLKREIEARRRVEDALRSSEAEARKLAMVASRTDNAVVITDASGRIEWVNDGFVRITEYTLEEVLGRKPGSILQGPGTDSATVRMIRERLAGGESVKTEILNYSRSGREYWLAMDIQPIRDPSGALIHFMAIQSDITERKQSELQLLERQRFVESIAEANPSISTFMTSGITAGSGPTPGPSTSWDIAPRKCWRWATRSCAS